MTERQFIGVVIFCLAVFAYGSGVFIYKASQPKPRDPFQIRLDTLYTILVGPDSSSILNTVTRIRIKLDSICEIEYQGRC